MVNVIPTTLLDTCGEEHPINISLKCSGLNDVVQSTIESKCTASVPEIPICNKTDTGMTFWLLGTYAQVQKTITTITYTKDYT